MSSNRGWNRGGNWWGGSSWRYPYGLNYYSPYVYPQTTDVYYVQDTAAQTQLAQTQAQLAQAERDRANALAMAQATEPTNYNALWIGLGVAGAVILILVILAVLASMRGRRY